MWPFDRVTKWNIWILNLWLYMYLYTFTENENTRFKIHYLMSGSCTLFTLQFPFSFSPAHLYIAFKKYKGYIFLLWLVVVFIKIYLYVKQERCQSARLLWGKTFKNLNGLFQYKRLLFTWRKLAWPFITLLTCSNEYD